MMRKSELELWNEKQNDIIKVFEDLGFRKDLQMLKARVMGVSYARFLNSEINEIEEYIAQWPFKEYKDKQLLAHIEQLDEDEKSVITAKYGIGTDGVYKTSKVVGEILGISSRKIPHINKRAISKLQKLYRECKCDQKTSLNV